MEQHKIDKQLELADLIASAVNVGRHKSGNKNYRRWRNRKKSRINEITEAIEYEKLTVFQRLRRGSVGGKKNTVFDNLKRSKRGV